MKEQIRRALENGCCVLVFPEGKTGAPAHRSRFRLDAFHAAVETSRPVHPVSVSGTSHLSEAAGHAPLRKKVRIVIGEAIYAGAREQREMIRLRDQAREVIGRSAH